MVWSPSPLSASKILYSIFVLYTDIYILFALATSLSSLLNTLTQSAVINKIPSMRTMFPSLVQIFAFLITHILCVSGAPANVAAVGEFLDCLRFHSATNYGYNVTSEGCLEIAPLEPTLKDVTDRSSFSICNYLFGISFYCSFSSGASIYQPDLVFEPIDEADHNDLFNRGLIASVPLGPISDFEYFNNRFHNYMAIGGSMGFSDADLSNVVNKYPR